VVVIISRSGLRSDCGSFHKRPGPPRGPEFGKTCVSLVCVRPLQGIPIGCSPPHAPLEGSFHAWPWGSLEARPRGLSHATPRAGCYVTGHDPSPAHAGGVVSPLTGGFPHTVKPTQLGRKRARPCRQVDLSGNTRPGRKSRRAHTHGVDRGKAPRATNTSCVTGSLLAHVEGHEETLTSRPLILSTPRPSPSNPQETPPQTPSEDPQEPFSQGPWGQSQRRTVEASDTALSWAGGKSATSHSRGASVSGAWFTAGHYPKSGLHKSRPLTGGLSSEILIKERSRDRGCGW